MSTRRCLRCLLREFDEAAYIRTLKERIDSTPARDRAGPEAYEKRLASCKSCDRLDRGTCLACGCYVELRAASRRSRCPYGKW